MKRRARWGTGQNSGLEGCAGVRIERDEAI